MPAAQPMVVERRVIARRADDGREGGAQSAEDEDGEAVLHVEEVVALLGEDGDRGGQGALREPPLGLGLEPCAWA